MIARFRREVDLVKRMKVRGVAETLDAGESDGLHYLAMELLVGEDLAALLRRRERLPADELLPIVDQLAETLDAAHALGIVHRDVKPQNIFLARDPTSDGIVVKLLDFGVARLLETTAEEKVTMTFAVVGTPGYLAPEQILRRRAIGAATAPRPARWSGRAVTRMAARVRGGQPGRGAPCRAFSHGQPPASSKVVESLTPDVDAVIALAIAKRPRHRYASARAFAEICARPAQGDSAKRSARALANSRRSPSEPGLPARSAPRRSEPTRSPHSGHAQRPQVRDEVGDLAVRRGRQGHHPAAPPAYRRGHVVGAIKERALHEVHADPAARVHAVARRTAREPKSFAPLAGSPPAYAPSATASSAPVASAAAMVAGVHGAASGPYLPDR